MSCTCENSIDNPGPVRFLKTSPVWRFKDYLGGALVRMSISRKNYSVEPGLYALGEPDERSDVLVTSNYKLSFDILRKNLSRLNVWILVLDTKGINVWCAAGKGTFGTAELISRIQQSKLHEVVKHRRLILPQLGAPGIAAFRVRESTGFKVKYGPVRAKDIEPFISSRYRANESMRTVSFDFKDRLILSPVEISNSLKYLSIIIFFFFLISGFHKEGYSIQIAMQKGIESTLLLFLAYISGAVITPVLLPWLPSRYFAAKGMLPAGIIFFILVISSSFHGSILLGSGWLFLSLAISSFLAMNFTGASTYTSLSGVKKEMKLFVPIQIGLAIVGFLFILVSNFIEV